MGVSVQLLSTISKILRLTGTNYDHFPTGDFWGFNESIRYGPSTTILSSTAGIFDIGTTLVLITTDR